MWGKEVFLSQTLIIVCNARKKSMKNVFLADENISLFEKLYGKLLTICFLSSACASSIMKVKIVRTKF